MEMVGVIGMLFMGLFMGSFLNVLADRLPRGEDVIRTRSHCDHCGHMLSWWELIPILSFVLLKARCAKCRKRLSFNYPLLELLTGAGFAYMAYVSPTLPQLLCHITLLSVFIVIFFADIRYQIIPDSMVIIGSIVVLVAMVVSGNWAGLGIGVLSGIGASFFFALLIVMTKGKGMGFGDVKLAFLLGLVTGFPGIILTLYFAFLTGALVGVILMIAGGKTLKSKVPFGPFLILGMAATLHWGEVFLAWWKGVI